MSKEILKADKLNKSFRDTESVQVLHDISLSVSEGEFVSIMGKSGCGKSSLLYLLSTLDTDYEGTVNINGTRITGLPENELARFRNQYIGFVFQFHFLLPEFTALENVMLPALKLGKLSEEEVKCSALEKLKRMSMDKFAYKQSGKLSGGQQQRVAIARALINDPRIVMADEPTGNLDSTNSSIIFDIFSQLVDEGNTIIVVTHDKDFAAKSNRIVQMVDGRITNPN